MFNNTAQIGGAGGNITVGIQSYLNDNGILNVVSRVWSATDPFGQNDGSLVSISTATTGNTETAQFEFTVGLGDEYYLLKEVVTYSDGSTSETSSFYYFTGDAGVSSDLIMQSCEMANGTSFFDNSSWVDKLGNSIPVASVFITSDIDISQPNDAIYDVSSTYGDTFAVVPNIPNYSVNLSNDQLLGLMYQTIIFNP